MLAARAHAGPHDEAPELLLLHGWGMSSVVWRRLLPGLQTRFRVTTVDLPGHGESHRQPWPATLPALAEQVLAVAPPRAWWLGWSLGALPVLQAARQAPERVSAVTVVAGTPCFVARPDWSQGMSPQDFSAFRQQFMASPASALRHFLALQCHGADSERNDYRALASLLDMPEEQALLAGLACLEQEDLRAMLAMLPQPLHWLLGSRDALVPVAVGDVLHALRPDISVQRLPQAAHLPFWSQPEQVLAALVDFARQQGLLPEQAA